MVILSKNNDNTFYVYIFLNPLKSGNFVYGDLIFKYEPFYIGKGKNNRINEHFRNSSLNYKSHKNATINKIINNNLTPIIIKIMTLLKIKLINYINFKTNETTKRYTKRTN